MATAGLPERTESERHEIARWQWERRKGFYIHLVVYFLVNIGLVILNLRNNPDHLWFYWVVSGWGIGVLSHAFAVFGGSAVKNWEERKIEELAKSMR